MTQHPLTRDPWSISDPETPRYGLVSLDALQSIQRTGDAIQAIARLVGNNAREPAATGAAPLDTWAVTALLGGVESLCEHMDSSVHEMLEDALRRARWTAARQTGRSPHAWRAHAHPAHRPIKKPPPHDTAPGA